METLLSSSELRNVEVFPQIASNSYSSRNNNFSINMTQSYLSQIDELCVRYLAVAQDSEAVTRLNQLAANAKQSIVSLPITAAETVEQFNTDAAGIVGMNVNESSLDIDRKLKAVKEAVESSYKVRLSSKQAELLNKLAKTIDIAGSMTDQQADMLYIELFGNKPDSNRRATLIAVVEDAVQNPEYFVDEQLVCEALVDYAVVVSNEPRGIARVPAVLAEIARVKPKDMFASDVLANINKLIEQQRTPSAIVAADYVRELQNNLKDWQAAMRYGAATGSSQLRPKYQAQSEKRAEAARQLVNDAQQLITDICKRSFACMPSFTATRNAIGEDILKVKLLANFGNADESTYNAICTILNDLGFKAHAYAVNSYVNWLIVCVDYRYYRMTAAMPLMTEALFDAYAIESFNKQTGSYVAGFGLARYMLETLKRNNVTAWYSLVRTVNEICLDNRAICQLLWNVADEYVRKSIIVTCCDTDTLRALDVDDVAEVSDFNIIPISIQEQVMISMRDSASR